MAKLLTDTLMMSWFYKPQETKPSRLKLNVLHIKTNTRINRKTMYR